MYISIPTTLLVILIQFETSRYLVKKTNIIIIIKVKETIP